MFTDAPGRVSRRSLAPPGGFVCQCPEPKDGAVYTMCDGLRGDSDCQDGLSCSVMVGLPS
jgi:hypothetical protein